MPVTQADIRGDSVRSLASRQQAPAEKVRYEARGTQLFRIVERDEWLSTGPMGFPILSPTRRQPSSGCTTGTCNCPPDSTVCGRQKMRFGGEPKYDSTSALLLGYAAVFGTHYEHAQGEETVRSGCFSCALSQPIEAYFDHQSKHVLGDNRHNLQLVDDGFGLLTVLSVVTSLGDFIANKVRAGELRGMSIGRCGLPDAREYIGNRYVSVYQTAKLGEVTYCEKGANPAAMALAVRPGDRYGVDIATENALARRERANARSSFLWDIGQLNYDKRWRARLRLNRLANTLLSRRAFELSDERREQVIQEAMARM